MRHLAIIASAVRQLRRWSFREESLFRSEEMGSPEDKAGISSGPPSQLRMNSRCSRNARFSALIASLSFRHSPPRYALRETLALPSGLVGPVD